MTELYIWLTNIHFSISIFLYAEGFTKSYQMGAMSGKVEKLGTKGIYFQSKSKPYFMIPCKSKKAGLCLVKSSEAHPLNGSFIYVIEEKAC